MAKRLSVIDQETLKYDLVASRATQVELAEKYGVSKAAITNFKQRHAAELDELRQGVFETYTGEFVRQQDWRMKKYAQVIDNLDAKPNSVEAQKTLLIALHQLAEETGQIPPRLTVGIVAVKHVIEGVDVDLL